ncbi:colicin D domain-containing protein, partial [Pseudomonas pseudonitroreducens]|uniref:colicin D domain-containing protein n=1 Tax=Pseudomonas pseudonitroreducens TaxID=2892326 RepID=UPI001F38D18F
YGGNVYRDGSLQKIVAHALMGGLLAEATGSDFKTGAMAAGVNEALANVLHGWAKGDPKFELMESQIVGVLAAAAVNGDVGKGAEIAKNATAYNRQLHPEEQRQIREKAKELEAQYGKIDLGSLTWEDMLTLSAGTAVDKTQSEQYLSLLKQLDGLNPDSSLRANFDHISEIAFNSVSTMGMGSEPLRWANGEPIIAHGQPVYAFQATAEQFADSNLFNQPYLGNQSSAAWANLQRALAQYGSDQTGTHNGEIGSFKGQIDQQQYIREALGLVVGDSVIRETTVEELLLPGAKGTGSGIGRGVRAAGEAIAGKIEAKLAESTAAKSSETIGSASSKISTGGAADAEAGLPYVRPIVKTSVNTEIAFNQGQLQHAFKHAADFGVAGNQNKAALNEFERAIQSHISDPGTKLIYGTYRGSPVSHFVNPSTGLNVIRDSAGNFLSGWKLNPQQLKYVLRDGKLGGG